MVTETKIRKKLFCFYFFEKLCQQNHQNVKPYESRSGPKSGSKTYGKGYQQTTKVATNVERVYKDNVYGIAVFKIVIWGGILWDIQ